MMFKTLLLSGAIAFALGAAASHKVTMWYYQAKETRIQLLQERLRVKALEDNLKVIGEALGKDSETAAVDAKNIEELDAHGDELVARASNRPALSADTVDGLRAFFGRSH